MSGRAKSRLTTSLSSKLACSAPNASILTESCQQRLGKAPEDYPDAKSQPHVQVALRMKAKGGTSRAGDVIPYVFCLEEGKEMTKTGQAERAKHPDEVRRAGSGLKIGLYTRLLLEQVFDWFCSRFRVLFNPPSASTH